MIKNLFVFIILTCFSFNNLKGEDLYILFTANVNGNLENCDCGTDPLGGVGRIKEYIDDFHNKHSNCIAIDGGDFLNSYPYLLLNETMFQVLKISNYDWFIPGEQEFVEGEEFFNKTILSLKNKVLISNLEICSQRERKLKYKNFNIYLYGYLSPESFNYIKKPNNISLLQFSSLSLEPKNGLNAIVFHGRLSEAMTIAEANNWIDLILLAHEQQEDEWQIGNTLIVGAGKDSESVAVIEIRKVKKDWKFAIERIKMQKSLIENKQVLDLIEQFKNVDKSNSSSLN